IFNGTECAAVIDWEGASLGGPEMDLAWWLVMDQWHAGLMGLPRLEGLGTRDETIDAWRALTGAAPAHAALHDVFAAYRLALVVQRGLTIKNAPPSARNQVLDLLADALVRAS